MNKRKAISKKLRFDIFKRDEFVCQYCGSHPPTVILHIDHIVPVKEGGDNSIDNLITACSSCNLGKSANLLSNIPTTLKEKAEIVKEAEAQLKEYSKIIQEKKDRLYIEKWQVAAALAGCDYVEEFNRAEIKTIEMFLQRLHFEDVIDAAEIAYSRFERNNREEFRYFCGICWNKVRENNNG